MMKFCLRKELPEATVLPKFYGVAWHEFWRNKSVCYPIPLNHILGKLRSLYFRLLHNKSDYVNSVWQKGYTEGYENGQVVKEKEIALRIQEEFEKFNKEREEKRKEIL